MADDDTKTEERNEIPVSAVQAVLAEAKERHDAGQSIVEDPDAEEEQTEAEADANEEVEAEVTESPEGEAEEVGDGEGEGEEEGSEDEAEDEGEVEPEGELEFVEMTLPPRNKGEDPIPFEGPAELKEDFARLNNGYMRGEEARAVFDAAQALRDEVAEDKAEIEFIDEQITTDPVGFVVKHVTKPEIRRDLLNELLSDETVWKDEKFQDMLETFSRSPEAREGFRTRVERDRLKRERELETSQREKRTVTEGVRATAAIIRSMIPKDYEPDRAHKFYRLALGEMAELGGRLGRTKMSREEIVDHLDKGGILDGYGIDPDAAGTDAPRGAAESGKEGNGARPTTRVRSRQPSEAEARETGTRLRKRGERRKNAAAIAPEGAGTPAATVELPREGIKARIARIRKTGFDAVSGGP